LSFWRTLKVLLWVDCRAWWYATTHQVHPCLGALPCMLMFVGISLSQPLWKESATQNLCVIWHHSTAKIELLVLHIVGDLVCAGPTFLLVMINLTRQVFQNPFFCLEDFLSFGCHHFSWGCWRPASVNQHPSWCVYFLVYLEGT
jgi:hypothetical protein